MKCPNCGCPFLRTTGWATADGHCPWKDEDGTWYNGTARQELETFCEPCGWSKRTIKKRGKTVSEEEKWPMHQESDSSTA